MIKWININEGTPDFNRNLLVNMHFEENKAKGLKELNRVFYGTLNRITDEGAFFNIAKFMDSTVEKDVLHSFKHPDGITKWAYFPEP